ncbi:hypothetical protein C4B24_03120 [Mycoplasma marinum]|uniref:Uncharacterized protein n=1 Tax=Mycoplasma marinum TaxID=1937190 RepID=A0A4V2NI12_9MOLU|nr:hypothetical protein C4B24_03120 [Mycoplasma marinum]
MITFNQNKKEENLKLLLSNYFKLKQKANFDIINKMLSISNDVFILWRECQAKIKKGDLDLELEKKLLNSMLEYKNALDNSKFSKKYIKLKKEVEDIKKEKQSFEEFVNKIKYSSQKNIKNVILEWENNRRIKLLNSKKTQTFSDYNFVYLDYLIVRKICYILKALKNSNVLFDGNISEKTEKLYNSLKEELKDKFEEFKNINNKSIKSEIKDIENIDEKVNYICTNFKNNFLLKENNTEYIYNVFLEKHSTLNISNLQELKKLLEIKIRDRDLEKNKNVETLISEEELQKFKEKYEAAEKADQDDLTNFKIEHNLKIQLIEQERTNILTEQNKLLDKNRIKSKNLFSSRLNELFNLKLNNNFKENVLFKKHALKEMKIMEKNNASLEKEMNKIQKDLNVIKAFITKSNNVKLKIKKNAC